MPYLLRPKWGGVYELNHTIPPASRCRQGANDYEVAADALRLAHCGWTSDDPRVRLRSQMRCRSTAGVDSGGVMYGRWPCPWGNPCPFSVWVRLGRMLQQGGRTASGTLQ
jgi:hypothetical protein